MSKNPLVRDSRSFEPVKLNLTDAISSVKHTNLQAYNRLVQLSKIVNIIKKSNVVMYELAYSLRQISKNQDYILYGYKTVAEMVETMYGYKKSSTSKMLAVAKNFLIMDADGKIESVFKSGDNDISMSNLYELLQDKQTMSLRKNELIEFYKNFPLHEMKQPEFRKLKSIAYGIIVSGKPLLYSSTYKELIMGENQSVKKQEAEQDDDQGNMDTNAIMQNSFQQTAFNATGDESVINIENQDIYNWLDQIAPFEKQESWDNSGLLIGSLEDSVSGILVTLDITQRAIEKAYQNNCNLMISHHPVIFSALKKLDSYAMPYQLIKHGISAICCHTNLDIAILNDLLAKKLCAVMDAESEILPLMPDGLGKIMQLQKFQKIDDIARQAKQALGCEVVRYSANCKKSIKKIGICSGSGASLLKEIAQSCDCLLTGDVKHDRWYKAEELDFALIDCGHYHTEIIMVDYLAQQLREHCPDLPVIAHIEENPVNYV